MSKIVKHEAKPGLVAGNAMSPIIPRNVEEAFRMSELIIRARMAPKDDTPEVVCAKIMSGMEIGMKPMQSVHGIAMINMRPTIWGDAALGLVQGSGLLGSIKEYHQGTIEGNNYEAICEGYRVGAEDDRIIVGFSMKDAVRAGLWGKAGPWKTYPQRMLQMRARSWFLRDGFADVLKGMQVTEEANDYEVVDSNAQQVASRPAPQALQHDPAHSTLDRFAGDPETGEVIEVDEPVEEEFPDHSEEVTITPEPEPEPEPMQEPEVQAKPEPKPRPKPKPQTAATKKQEKPMAFPYLVHGGDEAFQLEAIDWKHEFLKTMQIEELSGEDKAAFRDKNMAIAGQIFTREELENINKQHGLG